MSNLKSLDHPPPNEDSIPAIVIVNKDSKKLYKIFVDKGFKHYDKSVCTRVCIIDPERSEKYYHINMFHTRPHNKECINSTIRTSFSIMAGGLVEKGHTQAREETRKTFLEKNDQKVSFTFDNWTLFLTEML